MTQYWYLLKKKSGQCPRKLFLEDLRHEIVPWKEIRDSVIIDGDFNEDIQSSTFTDWKDRVGLEDVMKKRMEDSSSLPNTFNRDTKPIDTIIVNQRRTPVFNGLIAPIMTTWLFWSERLITRLIIGIILATSLILMPSTNIFVRSSLAWESKETKAWSPFKIGT